MSSRKICTIIRDIIITGVTSLAFRFYFCISSQCSAVDTRHVMLVEMITVYSGLYSVFFSYHHLISFYIFRIISGLSHKNT